MGETDLVQAELEALDEFQVLSEVWEMFSFRRVFRAGSWLAGQHEECHSRWVLVSAWGLHVLNRKQIQLLCRGQASGALGVSGLTLLVSEASV